MTEEEVKQQLKDTDEFRSKEKYESIRLYRYLNNQEEFNKLCKDLLLLHHTLDQNYLTRNIVDFKKNIVDFKNMFINIRDNVEDDKDQKLFNKLVSYDETINHLTSLLEKYETIILPLSA